jgi:hypothetical protein
VSHETAKNRRSDVGKTRLSYLVRHKRTGGYYARAYANGKEVWRSLKTKHFSIAESRLAEFLKAPRATCRHRLRARSSTFGAAAEMSRLRLIDNPKIKPRTRDYYGEILAQLKRSWPSLREAEVRKITPAQCLDWAARVAEGSKGSRIAKTSA